MIKRKSHSVILIVLLIFLLFFAALISISSGSVKISLTGIFTAIFSGDNSSMYYRIIYYVRIPRTFASVFAGFALSVSGVILQSVLNNSLASPGIIGVNSGAGLFTVLAAAFLSDYIYLSSVAAFTGALAAVFLVYFIAKRTGFSRMTIVLSGVAVSSFIGALTDTVLTLKPDVVIGRTAFLIGGFSGVSMDNFMLPGVLILVSTVLALILSYDLNVLSLGDESAKSLGLNVKKIRFIYMIIAAVLAGSAISFSGLIGFVGLIVPHISRLFVGSDNRVLLPVAALTGSIFTIICDLLARVIFAPYEIPVGIILSFLGGPFFIYLLIKGKRGLLHD